MIIDLLDNLLASAGEAPTKATEQPHTELSDSFSLQIGQIAQKLNSDNGGDPEKRGPNEQASNANGDSLIGLLLAISTASSNPIVWVQDVKQVVDSTSTEPTAAPTSVGFAVEAAAQSVANNDDVNSILENQPAEETQHPTPTAGERPLASLLHDLSKNMSQYSNGSADDLQLISIEINESIQVRKSDGKTDSVDGSHSVSAKESFKKFFAAPNRDLTQANIFNNSTFSSTGFERDAPPSTAISLLTGKNSTINREELIADAAIQRGTAEKPDVLNSPTTNSSNPFHLTAPETEEKPVLPQSSNGIASAESLQAPTDSYRTIKNTFEVTHEFSEWREDFQRPTAKKAHAEVGGTLENKNAMNFQPDNEVPEKNVSSFVTATENLTVKKLEFARSSSQDRDLKQETFSRQVSNALPTSGMKNVVSSETAPVATTRSQEFILRLTEIIQVQLRDGGGRVRILLNPENLGSLEIRAETTVHGITAKISTDSGNLKSYLENNLHYLQQSLQDQGLKIDRIDLALQEGFGDYSSAADQFSQPGSRSHEEKTTGGFKASVSETLQVEVSVDPLTISTLNPNTTFHTVA